MNRNKLFYMSKHRGCKELDIILGTFADQYLNQLTIDELIVYERLLMENDPIIYDAIKNIICKKGSVDRQLKYCESLLKIIAICYNSRYL